MTLVDESVATLSYESCTPTERLEAIEQIGALLSAATAELLSLIAVTDLAEDWKIDGAHDMASWLVAALRVSRSTARQWVDTAGRLGELPELLGALAAGLISWEQARPAAQLATAETDAALAREVAGWSVAQIETQARQRRPRPASDDLEAARQRRFRWRADHVLGGFRYSGFLPTERGEQLNQVLTRMAEQAGPDPATEL